MFLLFVLFTLGITRWAARRTRSASDFYAAGGGLTWGKILTHWDLIEADLQDAGIDTGSGILRERSWRWLSVRIIGLLGIESRLQRKLFPPKKTGKHGT